MLVTSIFSIEHNVVVVFFFSFFPNQISNFKSYLICRLNLDWSKILYFVVWETVKRLLKIRPLKTFLKKEKLLITALSPVSKIFSTVQIKDKNRNNRHALKTLYQTIQTFNDAKEKCHLKTLGKRGKISSNSFSRCFMPYRRQKLSSSNV